MQIFKKCTECIKSEIKLSNFGFEHHDIDDFYKSQWQAGEISVIYLIYRWIWALFFGGVFIACLALQFSDGKFFIFLTNWGITLCLLTNLIAACLVTRWHFSGCEKPMGIAESAGAASSSIPKVVKLYWCLHGVTLSLALVITTIYWAFLHGKMNKPMRYPVLSFITHCINSVFMLLDFIVIAFPFRILHSVYAMMLPIVYCLFTVVYFFCGGVDEYGNHHVYPILDWTKPFRGITTFMGTFGLYVIYGLLLFMVYKFRRFLRRSQSTKWIPEAGRSK